MSKLTIVKIQEKLFRGREKLPNYYNIMIFLETKMINRDFI